MIRQIHEETYIKQNEKIILLQLLKLLQFVKSICSYVHFTEIYFIGKNRFVLKCVLLKEVSAL